MGKRRRGGGGGGGGVCHEWRREGSCAFGDKCKFKHEDASNKSEKGNHQPEGNDDNEVQDGNCVPLYAKDVDPAARGPIKRPRSVEARSFTERIAADGTTRVLEHPNGLLIILLAQENPLCATARAGEIASIKYEDSLQDVEVSGKRKHGAVKVNLGATLVRVVGRDGQEHDITSPVVGRVVETNRRLEAEPGLLAGREGYLAVLSQTPRQAEKDSALLPDSAHVKQPETEVVPP
ncbi:Protein Simiate [Hondaea fermentalgiana]|uniref:Protein Simiate n=1 Tax=Hondaea fermentalgiana TaxID=2315210 RepID=A0A2R5G2G6_9STRA|nr:Protein Simiate [Hondaea fermentalgiana]|eukprot:GBG23918.1 Protein Simiate [Hondaea fermentalgiana]